MLILIDGNAMGHVHHNGTTLNHGTMQTQAVYGFTRMLRDIRTAYPSAKMRVLWDGRAQFRYDMYPDYKSNRDVSDDPKKQAHRDAYREQVPYIKGMCKALGIPQLRAPELEADDLAGFFVSRQKHAEPILLVTGDQDWLQLVEHQVTWLDPRGEGKRVNTTNFLDMTGYHTPQEFLDAKCLIGDSSDTIVGIDGFGDKTAVKFMATWRSVEAYWEAVDSGKYTPAKRKSKTAKTPHPEEVIASVEGRELFKRNKALMALRDMWVRVPKAETLELHNDPARLDLARALCERLAFVSILNNWDEWSRPFDPQTELRKAA